MASDVVKERAFLERVLSHLPRRTMTELEFQHWTHEDRPIPEGVGIRPLPASIRPEAFIERVMDVSNYVGNMPHLKESRVVADSRFAGPDKIRVYQRANVPMLKDVHHESVRCRAGVVDGYHCAYWNLLEPETSALSGKDAARSEYHSGVWLVKEGVVAYGLASVPRREDLGFLMWQALTRGAAAAAPKMFALSMQAMVAWAERVG